MTNEELLKQYGYQIWQDVEKSCDHFRNNYENKIEALLEYLGLKFDWKEEDKTFNDLVKKEVLPKDYKAAKLLKKWRREIKKLDKYEWDVYNTAIVQFREK